MNRAYSLPLDVQARTAGVSYLLVIAGGLFAEVLVRQALIVPGDAAATANGIAAHETLWRSGIAVHLLYLLPAIMINVLISGLFRATEPTLSRLALLFGVSGVTVEAVSLAFLYAPLILFDGSGTLAALGEGERQALAYLATRLFAIGFAFSLVLFAGFCVLIGALILRSRLVPRAIGALMMLAGVCYVVNTLALLVWPALWEAISPAILMPILLAELSLALWLLVKGVER
jgi:hypothetical protein